MPCTLNKVAWEKLIDEDIEWLDKQPDTLECKHIRQILEWAKKHKPDKQVERIKELEAENKSLKRRAEAAEEDWQDAEVENAELKKTISEYVKLKEK